MERAHVADRVTMRVVLAVVLTMLVGGLTAEPAVAWTETGQVIADYIVVQILGEPDPLDPESPYVYVRDYPLSEGDYIVHGSSAGSDEHYVVPGQYLAWIDSNAGCRFEHESVIVIVDMIGMQVDSVLLLDTMYPVILGNGASTEFVWPDLESPLGDDFYFPSVTYFDVMDSDAMQGSPGGGASRFIDGANSSSLVLYGNSEEGGSANTLSEIHQTLTDMGIPAGNRVEKLFPHGSDAGENSVRDAVAEAAGKGTGPNTVVFISAHAYKSNGGGVKFNKGAKGRAFSHSTLLEQICAGLHGTVKKDILLINGACYSGGMIPILKNLDCADCAGITFQLLTACRADETGRATRAHYVWPWAAWDFEEELEDHHGIWGNAAFSMLVAGRRAYEATVPAIDSSSQHPQRALHRFRACCKPGSRDVCVVLSQEACEEQDGTWFEDIDVCDPDPCASPTVPRSWGVIKALYR